MAIQNNMRTAEIDALDAPLVDSLTEEAPIVEMMPQQPTNAGTRHIVEQLKSIEAAQLVDLDGPLPIIGSETTVEDITLSVLGGEMTVGEDMAKRFGGAAKYFTKKLGPVLKETGSQLEKSFVYNTWRPYAKANGREINAGGTTADSMFSIVAVKFVQDETFGIFDPDGFGNGKVFDIAPYSNGGLHKVDLGNNVTAGGYAQRIKAYLGIQTANPRNVGSIVNIDLTAANTDTGYVALPSEKQMDDLLESVRAMPSNTYLLMHPKVANALAVYKAGRLEMTPMDENLKRRFKMWEDITIVTSRNFKNGTEAVVA